MDQLNNQQIVLLVMFVSFVTSIATGIVTVTLLEQTPPSINQTINRVVERTVETIVPEDRVVEVVREVPVEVPVSQTANTVSRYTPALVAVRLSKALDSGEIVEEERTGFIVSPDGTFVTEGDNLSPNQIVDVLYRGTVPLSATVLVTNQVHGIAIARFNDSDTLESLFGLTENGNIARNFPYVPLSKTEPSLGSPVIAMGQSSRLGTTVHDGIISRTGNNSGSPLMFEIDFLLSDENIGSPVLSMGGELLGLGVARIEDGKTRVVSANVLRNLMIENSIAVVEPKSTNTASASDAF